MEAIIKNNELNSSLQNIEFNEDYFKRNVRVAVEQDPNHKNEKNEIKVTKTDSDYVDSENEGNRMI